MKQKAEKKPLDKSRRRLLANGTYSMTITGIIIAAVIVINLIVQAVPSVFLTADLTDQKLYSIGEVTKEMLDTLEQDVTLYFVTETGQEDEGVEKLLDTYAGYSEHIQIRKIDAVADPTFAAKYSDSTVSLNSVIAVSGERSKVADYSDFYLYEYNSYTYQQSGYDAEGKITGAIAYAVSDHINKVCYTVGHDEMDLGNEIRDVLEKSNIDISEINLLSQTIPADCTALIIFAPGEDLTEEEVKKVRAYLDYGGHALIVTMPEMVNGAKTENLDSVLLAYGVKKGEGIVMEGDENCYVQAPYLILPSLSVSSEITTDLLNSNIVYPLGEAISYDEDSDESVLTVTPLMTTSEKAYLKTDLSNTVMKEEGDTEGSFVLAAAIEQTLSNDSYGTADVELNETESETKEETKATRILYFTSPCVLNSNALSTLIQQTSALPEGNKTLISSSFAYLSDLEVKVSVPAKTLSTPQTTINTGTVNLLGSVFMFVLPAAVLLVGIVIWLRRRKR